MSPEGQLASARFELSVLGHIVTLITELDIAAPSMSEAELRDAVATIAEIARQRCPAWAR